MYPELETNYILEKILRVLRKIARNTDAKIKNKSKRQIRKTKR